MGRISAAARLTRAVRQGYKAADRCNGSHEAGVRPPTACKPASHYVGHVKDLYAEASDYAQDVGREEDADGFKAAGFLRQMGFPDRILGIAEYADGSVAVHIDDGRGTRYAGTLTKTQAVTAKLMLRSKRNLGRSAGAANDAEPPSVPTGC